MPLKFKVYILVLVLCFFGLGVVLSQDDKLMAIEIKKLNSYPLIVKK